MKQGQAGHDVMSGTKVEPRSHAISPAYTNQMGVAYGTHLTDGREVGGGQSPMTTGPGLRAPMVGTTQHHCGSQGKR